MKCWLVSMEERYATERARSHLRFGNPKFIIRKQCEVILRRWWHLWVGLPSGDNGVAEQVWA